MANQISFGGSVTAVNRFTWRSVYNNATSYLPFDCVSYLGTTYVCLGATTGNLPTNATFWDAMTSAGGVSTVAGRSGNVVLVSSDISDHDAALGVPLLDASGFLKAAEFNTTINAQTGVTYAIAAGDRGKLVTFSNASPVAVSIAQATGSFAAGYYVELENIGAGLVTITPATSTVEGAATVTLKQWESIVLTSAGGNYVCLRSKVRIATADLPGGTTGSGAVVLATSPTLVTPVLGVATGTSLALGGGTALTTTNQTGTGSIVLATSPTLVTPALGVATATTVNKVTITAPATSATLTIANSKTLAANNSLTLAGTDGTTINLPASGNVVGTTDTQTLSSKTLQGAASGNAVTLLNEQGPTAALTGNAADQTVYTFTLPANVLQAGKGIRVRCWINHNSGAVIVAYKLFFGATAYLGNNGIAVTGQMYGEAVIFNNAGVTNTQHGSNTFISEGGAVAPFTGLTSAVDTTAGVIVKVTFNVASPNQVTGGQFLVELIQ